MVKKRLLFQDFEAIKKAREPWITKKYYRESDDMCLIVKRQNFNWALMLNHVGNSQGCEDKWEYATQVGPNGALDAAERWLKEGGDEPTMWHRHPRTGRRRYKGDPATEVVRF
jgi:hypothetical protein